MIIIKELKSNKIIQFITNNYKKILNCLFIIIIFYFAINRAFNRTAFLDFYAIDGDFQNFNAWHRLLSGFTPYRDFTVYLGIGHLIIGSLFTFIFGGNFASSLFAGVFLTIMFAALTIFVLSKLITRNTTIALIISYFIISVGKLYPNILDCYHYLLHLPKDVLSDLTTPGASARIIRGSCVVIYIIIAYFLIKKLYNKNFFYFTVASSFFAGAFIVFSNDTGVATYLTASFAFLIILIKKFGKNIIQYIKYISIWIIVSLISAFMVIIIVSRGNIYDYFTQMFATSKSQFWYYQSSTNMVIYSPADILKYFSFVSGVLLIFIFLEIYFVIRAKDQKTFFIHLGIMFIYLSFFTDSWIYSLLSSVRKFDWINVIVFVSIISYIFVGIKFILIKFKKENLFSYSYILLAIYFIFSLIPQIYYSFNVKETFDDRAHNGEYYKKLGGYLSNEGIPLYVEGGLKGCGSEGIDNLMKIIKGKKFFSTYSSAINVLNDTFAPVKEDYIIHVLGEQARKEYLDKFQKGNYQFVLTPSVSSALWYYTWISNANWFFYSEVFKNYEYKGTYGYLELWEKQKKTNIVKTKAKIEENTIKNNAHSYKITTDKKDSLIANVRIKYSVVKNKGILLHSNLLVNSPFTYSQSEIPRFGLPNKGEFNIPVDIEQGEGNVDLIPVPKDLTKLKVEKFEIINFYKKQTQIINQ